ncbi:hypothetical protein B0H14DRAFT_2584952 [Mycena olivaceomarginata]|nr:hypothetical protein B0H14DRAFT_2584952 [Mycena olivaceomarginata]
MARWWQWIDFLQYSDRVPVMHYLRPVPRLKPLSSAITSVFVSTFAMLSALWTIFSLGAGALARRTGRSCEAPESSTERFPLSRNLEQGIGWETSALSGYEGAKAPWHDDMMKMRRTLNRIRLGLEKQGFVVGMDDDQLDSHLESKPPNIFEACGLTRTIYLQNTATRESFCPSSIKPARVQTGMSDFLQYRNSREIQRGNSVLVV